VDQGPPRPHKHIAGRYGMGWGRVRNRSKVWNWRDGGGRDPRSAYAEQSPQGGGHAASAPCGPCFRADPGAARCNGHRPRGLVGQGFYPQEDAAVSEIVAASEQKTGKQVEQRDFSRATRSDQAIWRRHGGDYSRTHVRARRRTERFAPNSRPRSGARRSKPPPHRSIQAPGPQYTKRWRASRG
jgi:hypothetical protein